MKPLHLLVCAAVVALAATRVCAQMAVPVDLKVAATFSGDCPDGEGRVELSGTFAPRDLSANSGVYSATEVGNAGNQVTAAIYTALVQPGRVYDLYYDSAYVDGVARLSIEAPQGYQVVLDNKPRPVEELSYSPAHVAFQLIPRSQDPILAGYASSVAINHIDWRMPLGTLQNGDSAGSIGLIDPGFAADWSNLCGPGALYYESSSDDISTYYEGGVLRQVFAKQIIVDVVVIDGNSYEIRCYNPQQQTDTWSTPRQLTGTPFATYRIARGTPQSTDPSAVALLFTKEVRHVTDATSTFPITRREFMTLERTGSAPNFQWTKRDWYHEGESPLSETVVQSSTAGQVRTETIVVRTPGSSSPALSLTRTFELVTGVGEMLTSETAGSSNSAPLRIAYYSVADGNGMPGTIKSVVYPDGRWVGFRYSRRLITGEYRPYLNSPATVTFDPLQGEAKFYTYVPGIFGEVDRLNCISTYRNGVRVELRVLSCTDAGFNDYWNGMTFTDERTMLSLSSQVNSTTKAFRPDYPSSWLRGKTVSILNADGSKIGFKHTQTPTAYTEIKVTGYNSTSYGQGMAYMYVESPEYVFTLAGKSVQEITSRDARGLLTRFERLLCVDSTSGSPWGGTWRSLEWTNCTYNFMGLLTDRVSSKGLTYHAVYDGFLKLSETDESGVTMTYSYDAANRIKTLTRAAIGPIPEQKTSYTYDAMGRVLTTTIGPDNGEQLVSATTYDDGGRVVNETGLGGYGNVSHAYDLVNRSHTVTHNGAGTTIETRYLDGTLYSKTGTGVIAEYHTRGVETDGRTWARVDIGSPSSSRWSKSWVDWGQQPIRTESSGFATAANLVSENFYDTIAGRTSTGHVYRATKPGPNGAAISTRSDYNLFGEPFRTGLDVDNNGLVLTSNDRISESNQVVEYVGTSYWVRRNAYTYAQPSNATATLTGFTRERATGFTGTLVSETETQDADGNITNVKTNVDAATATKTVTTTTTGVSNARVETYRGGLLVSVTTPDGLTTSTTYDALLRPSVSTDARNNTTTTTYVPGTTLAQTVSQKVTATTNAVVTTHYDAAGRTDWTENADGKRTYFAYNARNQPLRQWGAATYPVEYAYSAYGEKIAMRTFRTPTQDFTTSTWPLSDDGADPLNPDPTTWTSGDKTTWTYDSGTGLLSAKTDAAGRSATYTYNAANQLATREWARTVPSGPNAGQHVRATYGYDATTGEQTSISYNDGTPTVSYTYTRLGQPDTVTDGTTGVHDFVYDPTYPHRLSCEAFDTFYDQRVMTRLYDTGVLGRVRGFQLGSAVGSNSDLEQSYGWASDSGRFNSVSSTTTGISTTARNFRYGYEANSSLVKTLWTDDNSFFASRTFDPYREILTAIDTKWGQTAANSLTKYEYHSNALGERDSVVQSGDAFAAYAGADHAIHQTFIYDDRGEVQQAPTFAGSTVTDTGTPLSNRQHEFSYDAIGNRSWAGVTGDAADRKVYTTNALNQIQSRDNRWRRLAGPRRLSTMRTAT